MLSETKVCQNCKQNFTIEPEDFDFYSRMKVPAPTFCTLCRLKRLMAFRNERNLYLRKCDLCKKDIVSMYSPDKPYTVYCTKCYWSDKWDSYTYAQDYDFSRPFFEQFSELQKRAPLISLVQDNAVNSEWVNFERDAKNCYLDVGGEGPEDSAYNTYAINSSDSFDCYWVDNCELTYESIKTENSYKTFYSFWCFDCNDAWFSYDCSGCSNIIGCAGLRRKNYHIFNKPVSKSEYDKFVKENLFGSREKIKELWSKAEKVRLGAFHRATYIERSVNSTGNFINSSKNCKNCWDVRGMEDCKNAYIAIDTWTSHDVYAASDSELVYQVMSCGEASRTKFSYLIWRGIEDVEYSHHIFGGKDCFGSVGLKKGKYTILNKRYSKEDYFALKEKIIKHMDEMPYKDKAGNIHKYGDFFPAELSLFGHNETAVQDHYPLKKNEALQLGFNWSDFEAESGYKDSGYSVPDEIKDVGDDILEKVLACNETGKLYRVIKMELDFYRKVKIPVPIKAPLTRHRERFIRIPARMLYDRECKNCGKKIKAIYAPDRPEIVYCEECYKKEVA